MVGDFLGVSTLVVVAWQQRVVGEAVRTGFEPEEELVHVAFVERFFGSGEFFRAELAVVVFVELLGQKVVALGDRPVAVQVI